LLQLNLDVHDEIVIDNFAGGGGASHGIEAAIGRRIDVAINHDPEAIAVHRANHPETEHHCESVWEVDPRTVKPGRPIGLLWLSPDCKHFSKAKGGKPVEKNIRGLAWVALRWAAIRKPRVIMLENVEEFVTWGPLTEGPDGKMRPCPKRKGREFNAFRNALQRHGYQVEFRELRACDYGAPTIRKRLFLIARRDGQPIVWPAPTHGDPKSAAVKSGKLRPWRTAAECIDWSLDCPSIFERTRPLADATCRRIAKGIMRYVINAAEPFIVNTRNGEREGQAPRTRGIGDPFWTITAQGSQHAVVAPVLTEHANASSPRSWSPEDPLRTICAQTKGGHHALVTAFLAKHYTGVVGSDLRQPAATVTAVDHHSLVAANLVHMGHGEQSASGAKRWSHGVRDAEVPLNTITANGIPAGIVTSNLVKLKGTCKDGQPVTEPIHTIQASGNHYAEVRAFLTAYYGVDQDPRLEDPMHTVTAKDRFGLVTVSGQDYAIADIGLRMLAPKELFKAQGFPAGYIFEWGIDEDGRRIALTKSTQVRLVGNSVCPPLADALVRENLPEMSIQKRRAA